MYDVCICLYCMYLLVFSAAKSFSRIDTDTFCEIHTINTKYIKNKSKIQHQYIQIHTNTYTLNLWTYFFQAFFSVCILFVFVCIVSILIDGIYRYMSHTLELLCACMCMYCMYVHVFFQYAFPPVRFSWRKTCLRCCFAQVTTN